MSSLPLSVLVRSGHACVNLSRLRSGFLSRRRCALAAGWTRDYPRTFSLREILKCAHLKFTVYGRKQTNKHVCNAVTLVWGSLRVAPMRLDHTFGLTSSGKTGSGGTYSRVIVNELRAAKHEAFSRRQGKSVLHILLQVGVIASM